MKAEGPGCFYDEWAASRAAGADCRPQLMVAGANGLTCGHTDSMPEKQIRFAGEEKKIVRTNLQVVTTGWEEGPT